MTGEKLVHNFAGKI